MEIKIYSTLWIFLIIFLSTHFQPTQQMECKYGERGSLTVYCINATSDYFKTSRYRYDHLDETLKCINCSLNSIESGSFDISGNQIKTVDLRRSKITAIKIKAFIGLIFMEKLLLSYNTITDLEPGAFIGIRKLKFIELEYAISELRPKVFQELHVLEVLILRNNDLKQIVPGTFDGLHNLKLLDISNNKLDNINNSFSGLVNLRALKLNDNLLTVIYGDEFKDLNFLLVLNLENNKIKNFTINKPGNSLRSIILKSNLLTEDSFKPQPFLGFDNLEDLDLSQNFFKVIPRRFFFGLFRLRTLNLKSNNLQQFSTGSYSGLPHLRSLTLCHNQIENINISGRRSIASLEKLDLSFNRLTDFDYILLLSKVPKLSQINLENNDLSCKIVSEISLIFSNDNIDFIRNPSDWQYCPNDTRTLDQLFKDLSVNYKKDYYASDPVIVWMYVLTTFIIVLLAILFYAQYFILSRNNVAPPNFKIMKNLTSFTSSRFR